ncbi:MAG: DUF4838 domain-containing protein [Ruminococcaceae bacterium]|nr:DUF4838 domain-containing protein [Oscillospiraceae bacterium]
MKLTKETKISIVTPLNASPREDFSAEELKKYLKQILGCDAEICREPASDSFSFILGAPSRNQYTARYMTVQDFNALVPGPEGMMIKCADENTIILAGSDGDFEAEYERGTLYAVYEFLERYMGVSFAAYVNPDIAGGDEIPVLDEWENDGFEYTKPRADLPYRTAIVQYGDAQGNSDHGLNISFFDWLARNRYNRILTWGGIYDGYKKSGLLEEALKRGIRFTVGHHAAPKMFLPPMGNEYFPEHYYQTHPEYYKLKSDGTRFYSDGFYGQWIFCSRNEELIEEISGNIIKWVSDNPAVDIIALWPQDGRDEQCQCEECSKYSKVTNYTYFLNAVAKRVSAVHPHVKIDMLVYVDLWEPPAELELEPCLMIDEATWHSTGLRKAGAHDGSGIIGTHFENTLLQWHELGAEVVYYDYYMGVYPARNRLIPMADELNPLYNRFVEKGIMGSGTQIECYNLWNHIFNFYCFARTAYDTGLTVDTNLERFSRIFGKGAPYICEIIKKTEDFLEGQQDIQRAGRFMMLNIDKNELYALFDKALDAADTPRHRNNVRMIRMAFRYSDVESTEVAFNEVPTYTSLRPYIDKSGELYYMSRFDSFKHNDPGYGIMIPVDCPESDKFIPDRWYEFENK